MDQPRPILGKIRQWVNALRSRRKREVAITFAIGAAIGITFSIMVWGWIESKYLYNVGYIRTALGDSELDKSCARFLSISNPSYLRYHERIKWESCQGMGAGFENREEGLDRRFVDVLWEYASSMYETLGPLPPLIAIAYILFCVLPSLFNKIEMYGSSFFNTQDPAPTLHLGRYIPGEWINTPNDVSHPRSGNAKQADWHPTQEETNQFLPNVESNVDSNTRNQTGNDVTSPNGKTPPPILSPRPAHGHNDTAEIQRLQRENAQLLKENVVLRNEVRTQEGDHKIEVNNLEAQLKYLQGAGSSVIGARQELDTANAQIKTQQSDIDRLNLLVASMQRELDNERATQSGACKNGAGCSIKIQQLEKEKKLLLQTHQENDLMVQSAARDLGKSPEEAKIYTLRTYIRELTVITQTMVAQLKAGGTNSANNLSIFDFATNQANQIRIQELTDYCARLEFNVERLGGNSQMTRMGLAYTGLRPNHELTYEDYANNVFPIYVELCQKINYLDDLLVVEKKPPPAPAAATAVSIRSYFHDRPNYPVQGFKDGRGMSVKSLKFQNNESLLQSLVFQELTRLLDRGIELCTYIATLPEGTGAPWEERVVIPVREAQIVCRNVTRYILDDPRPVQTRTTFIEDSRSSTRADRRFKIWCAMQEAILSLTNGMCSLNSIPPAWDVNLTQPLQSFVAKRSFESLAKSLMEVEINTLDHRIADLLTFMESQKLPGTTHGPPRTQGPPDDQADRNALVAAKSFAELTRSHWLEEHAPKTPRRVMLPLDYPPLLHAVRRRTGRVLVPQTSTFPFRKHRDGSLINVGLGESLVEWKVPPAEEGSFARLKRGYWRYYNRVQQLSRCLRKADSTISTPRLWQLRPGKLLDDQMIEEALPRLGQYVRDLDDQMRARQLPLPEWLDAQYDLYPPPPADSP